MACCCVAEMVDMKNPIPKVLKRKSNEAAKSRGRLPFRGMENQKMAKMVTMSI